MSRRPLIVLLLIAIVASVATAQTAPSTQPAANELKLTTDRLVVFKDGHGLVIQTGKGTADAEGRAFVTDVPDSATLGCFWAVGEQDAILAMRAEWVETREIKKRETPCLTIAEIIRANLGKPVTLELADAAGAAAGAGDKGTTVTRDGKLLELLEVAPDEIGAEPAVAPQEPGTPQPPFVYRSRFRSGFAGALSPDGVPPGEGTITRDLLPRGGDLVVVSVEGDRRLVIPVASVKSIRAGADVVTTTTRQQEVRTRSKRLSFDFGKSSAGKAVSLKLFYFTPGLRWIPTYRVSGELKDSANLALQGEILNDVTDADHAALDLVVGVPHFRFDQTPSPLTLEQTLRSALAAAGVDVNNGMMLNSQVALDNRARVDTGLPAQPAIAPELTGAAGAGGAGEQDLFVYSVNDFSLKKGARATVPLWQQSSPLRHVYTFNINAKRSQSGGRLLDDAAPGADAASLTSGRLPNRIVLNQVWHQLELTNAGDVPWTTGAALLLRGTLPLGQDLLVYTPPRGKTLVPVTVAVDLRGSIDEEETQREENAAAFDGHNYTRVTKRGTIALTSFRKEKSTMRVALAIGGKVTSASDGGKITLNDVRGDDWADGALRYNNHSDVTWELEVDPGAAMTLTYEVSFYTH
jgi:hypothetical protein